MSRPRTENMKSIMRSETQLRFSGIGLQPSQFPPFDLSLLWLPPDTAAAPPPVHAILVFVQPAVTARFAEG